MLLWIMRLWWSQGATATLKLAGLIITITGKITLLRIIRSGRNNPASMSFTRNRRIPGHFIVYPDIMDYGADQ